MYRHPQNSYGLSKVVGERLLSDHSHRGFVDGRAMRSAGLGLEAPIALDTVIDEYLSEAGASSQQTIFRLQDLSRIDRELA
jgi:nucleoside-diphosphate-sugar epimerase